MAFVLDLIGLLIAFCTIFACCKRGFVRSMWEMGKTLISFGCAWLFGKHAGEFIATKYLDNLIAKLLLNNFLQQGASDVSSLTYSISEPLEKLLQICGINAEEMMSEAFENADTIEGVAESLALPISEVISNLIGFIVTFVIAYFVLWLLVIILDKVVSLPVLKGLNRLLGACLGLVCSIMVVILFVAVVKAIAYCGVTLGGKGVLMNLIDDSCIFKYFSNLKLMIMLN